MKDRQTISSILYVSAGVLLILTVLLLNLDLSPAVYANDGKTKRPESDLEDNVWSDTQQFKSSISIDPRNINITNSKATNYNKEGNQNSSLLGENLMTFPQHSISISGGNIHTGNKTNSFSSTPPPYNTSGIAAVSNIELKKPKSSNNNADEEIVETGSHQMVLEESNPNAPVAPITSTTPLFIIAIISAIATTIKKRYINQQ